MLNRCRFLGLASLALVLTACGSGSGAASPATPGTPNPEGGPTTVTAVQHLIVVVLQNASFDHLFGTFPATGGNAVNGIRAGVPGYVQYDASGNPVSPILMTNLAPKPLPEGRESYTRVMNGGLMDKYAYYNGAEAMGYYDGTTSGVSTLWTYAQQYALADNYFSSVIGEAPTNQLYMVAASDNDFPYSVQPYYGPCNQADAAAKALTFPNVGDQLTEKKINWAAYQEDMGVCSSYIPLHDPFQYFTTTNAASNRKDYTKFAEDIANNRLPSVSFVFPNNANDMHPGYGPITQGAAFVDALVKTVQASSYWSSTAIVVTWDTGGGWYDHVPPPTVDSQGLGSRVPMLVISPLAKQGYVSHVQMDHVSILKFIQMNWGLPSLNARNEQSQDISDMFR